MATIPYEKIAVETVADDGTVLKGVINYWAKDYGVELHHPVKGKAYGGHMPYFVQTTFMADPESDEKLINKNGRHYVNVCVKGRELLKKLYEENK